MIGAETMWGLMAPIGKFVLSSAVITPLLMTDFRMIGAACLFWIASLFAKPEHVHHKDMLSLFFAALFGIVFNQGSYIFGLGMTSPINASIVTTSLPILTMVIAAIYLREPITGKKLLGVFIADIRYPVDRRGVSGETCCVSSHNSASHFIWSSSKG